MSDERARPPARSDGRRNNGRRVGQTSPAIAQAARAAGELGGRPPAKLPKELLAELGPPPTDLLAKDGWWSRLIEILEWGDLEGEPWAQKLERACKAAQQAARLREGELKARVADLMEREQREIGAEVSPPTVERGKDPIASAQRNARRRDPT